MDSSKFVFRAQNRAVPVGREPLVVGTLSSLTRNLAARKYEGSCDVVEVRLDCAQGVEDWLARCRRIESLGWPVLLTLRLRAEGGQWTGSDASRAETLILALESLAAIDVELRSSLAPSLATLARKLGKICVVSYHDFDKTPSLRRLEAVVAKAQRMASIVKISTKVRSESDLETLASLLRGKWERPLCVIGMGEDWKETRVSFARAGSCLTYGYLDKPAAPGQMSSTQLMRKLGKRRDLLPAD